MFYFKTFHIIKSRFFKLYKKKKIKTHTEGVTEREGGIIIISVHKYIYLAAYRNYRFDRYQDLLSMANTKRNSLKLLNVLQVAALSLLLSISLLLLRLYSFFTFHFLLYSCSVFFSFFNILVTLFFFRKGDLNNISIF